jgi:hypothetical protein
MPFNPSFIVDGGETALSGKKERPLNNLKDRKDLWKEKK